jgi:cytochrome oxidase Cu insertion factor (SCO1/SenC/PrrC family)/thiol-disulfide isomerase/thioredoxin
VLHLTRRRISSRWRLLLGILLASVIGTVGAVQARADGDPGSDVLVYQPLFVAADAGAPVPLQVQLTTMLRSTASDGVPIRVAIISHRADLGAVTALWRKPQTYARFLGIELSLSYKGRLLVVMPNGFGVNWPGHPTIAAARALASIAITPGGAGLIHAAETATTRLAAAAGVTLTTSGASGRRPGSPVGHHDRGTPTIVGSEPAHRRAPMATGSGTARGMTIAIVVAAVLAVLALALVLSHRERWKAAVRFVATRRPTRARDRSARPRRRWALPALTSLGMLVLGAVAVIAFAGSSGSTASALATNPDLDPGTALADKPAPNFTLYDQTGHPVSLRSFRGKVTLLAFNDSECTTICPLTTTAMLDAKRMLGRAGANVQLLGVDANPKATQIEDVLSYTELHGLIGRWDFLTGSLPQLKSVWRAYGVQADIERGLISHTPALYVIDPAGRLRELYMTQQSYASVEQFAQILARRASSLLPGHPGVHSHLSYTAAPTTPPTRSVTLPRAGGRRVKLGPGRPRLYLFFDTWDREVSSLAGELDAFNGYATRRLPSLTAVDEGSVEPSRRALPSFLAQLPQPLRYPVAIDTTGRVADGYEVQGVPWLVLTSASGQILWYDEIVDAKWPSAGHVRHEVRAALNRPGAHGSAVNTGDKELIGSPAPLAGLHRQASRLIGSERALAARIKALRGYPIVVNVWASWCQPCKSEFGLLASASLQYGREVAFLGADTDDSSGDATAFLAEHHVSYPSYADSRTELGKLIPGGVEGYPTTVFINRDGKVVHVHTGQYDSQGTLDSDIKTYALGAG